MFLYQAHFHEIKLMENDKSFWGSIQLKPGLSLRSGIVSALVCYLASASAALTLVVLNHNYGRGDISSFLYLSLPFAFVIGSTSFLLPESIFGLKDLSRYCSLVCFGAVIGVLWSMIVAAAMGPWFHAFSFPVTHCWFAGGAIGMISGSRNLEGNERAVSITKLCFILIIFVLVLGTAFSSSGGTKAEKLEIVWAKYMPGPNPLSVNDNDRSTITETELDLLRKKGLKGTLTVSAVTTHGDDGNARALIVLEKQLAAEVDLEQPDHTGIIYLQREGKWEKLPTNAPTVKRKIHLEISNATPNETSYWVELETGAHQGGKAFVWK